MSNSCNVNKKKIYWRRMSYNWEITDWIICWCHCRLACVTPNLHYVIEWVDFWIWRNPIRLWWYWNQISFWSFLADFVRLTGLLIHSRIASPINSIPQIVGDICIATGLILTVRFWSDNCRATRYFLVLNSRQFLVFQNDSSCSVNIQRVIKTYGSTAGHFDSW